MINVYRDPEGKNIYTSGKTPDGTTNVLKGGQEHSFSPLGGEFPMSSNHAVYQDIVKDPFMKNEDKIVALVRKIEEIEQNAEVS